MPWLLELGLRGAKLPRAKPCGGAISAKALRLIGGVPSDIIQRRLSGFKIGTAHSRAYTFRSSRSIGITVLREDFDYLLTQKAISSGAVLSENTRLKSVKASKSDIVWRERSEKCRVLIGADGAHGIVARLTGIRKKRDPNKVGVAIEGHSPIEESVVRGITGSMDQLALFF